MCPSLSLIANTTHEPLDRYRSERDHLLRCLQEAAERDERIVAAWLFGSLGRGDEDELSDIDLCLIVQEAHLEEVIAERYAFLEGIGELLLVQEAPQNAPPGGAYNMAVYAAPVGPHTVDFYWQPAKSACIPPQSRLIFDRIGLPVSETPTVFEYQPVPEISPEEAVGRAVLFFWVMVLITAKYVGRSPFEERMGLLKWAIIPLADCERFLDHPSAFPLETVPPHTDPASKTHLLRDLVARMESLAPKLTELGVRVAAEMPAHARRYLDFIDGVAAIRPQPTVRPSSPTA